jgi:DNA primase
MYNPNFTFRYLKTRVTIGDVLASYGLDSQLKRRNDQLYGPCPLHHGDNPTAFRVHLTRGLWRCFTSCGGGDTVDLIRCIENCSYAEAAHHLYRLIDRLRPARSYVTPTQHCSRSTFFPFRRRIPLNPWVPFLQNTKKISISTAINH